jgi:phosphatidylinositol glycan class B
MSETSLFRKGAQVAKRCDPYVQRILKSYWTLAAICALALVLRMAVAILFPGFEHPDEVFQMLEQAHRVAFGNGFIPWEFDEGVRSYFFVGILAAIFRGAERVAPGRICWRHGWP